MKKLLAGAMLLGLASQAAYATQARLIALGLDELDNEGSHYIQDSRNIFLNAANVNNYGDMVILELGQNGYDPATTTAALPGTTNGQAWVDQDTSPKAQGGFLKRVGKYVIGAYLGNESNTSAFLRVASTSNAAALNRQMLTSADNQLDLFVGSELSNGIKWGANLVYLNNENENIKQEEKAGSVRLGLIGQKWDVYLNASFMNTAESEVTIAVPAAQTAKHEFDGKLGIHVGGGHELGKGRVYGYFKTFSWDQKDGFDYTGFPVGTVQAGKTGTNDGKFDTYMVGYGVSESVNTNGRLFTDVHVKKTDIELKLANTVEVNTLIIPVTLGYEHDATSWLTLRGSIVQNIWGTKDNKNFSSANAIAGGLIGQLYNGEGKGSIQNTTRVQSGATLTFGNLNVDGLIGTSTAGNLSTDDFFSRAAITYKF